MSEHDKELIAAAFSAGLLVGIALIMLVLLFVRNIADVYGAELEVTPEYVEVTQEFIEITEGPESAVEVVPELEYLGEFRLTAYCPCSRCNGKWGAIDRYGDPLIWGTIAVDPKVIPLQTKVVIDGLDMVFTARDTGGKWVQGKHIDIFYPVSHSEAKKLCKDEKVKVWKVVKE